MNEWLDVKKKKKKCRSPKFSGVFLEKNSTGRKCSPIYLKTEMRRLAHQSACISTREDNALSV